MSHHRFWMLLSLWGSLLVPAAHAAPNPPRLQLTISTPDLPSGSPFEVTLVVMEAPAHTPVSLLAPERVQWQVIPAGCQGENPIICQPDPTWVGSFRGQVWETPGTRLVFRAQMGDLTSTVTTEIASYQPPPTREPPVTATPLPTATPSPTAIPTALPTPIPTPSSSPTPWPSPTAVPAPVSPLTSVPPGAGGQEPPAAVDHAAPPLPPALPRDPPPEPGSLASVTVEEIPLTAAAQPTTMPLMVVPVAVFACYDASQNKVCDVNEGITGLTVYVMDGRAGTVLGQALTDSSGRASLTVRVSEQAELVVSVPSFGATQRTSARAPSLKPILVGTVVPLPALLP